MTSLPGFGPLHEHADALSSPVPLAVAGGADRTVLEALRAATDRGWVTARVVGPEEAIRRLADESGISLNGLTILNIENPRDQAAAAVLEVRAGRARVLAKGQIDTPTLMDAVLDPEFGLRVGRVVSQVVLMEILDQGRRFLMADTGVSVKPKLATRVEIVRQVIEVARGLGVDHPRVALMAASEAINSTVPETIDALEIQRRNQVGEFPGATIQGPLSFDLAYSSEAGGKKQVVGRVVGRADGMVFPDLLSANLTVKAIMYTARCQFGGVLKGTTVPVAFMSRADTTATRLNSLALALRLVES